MRLGETENYDIASNAWTSGEPVGLNEPCSGALGGLFYVFGGTSNGPAEKDALQYDLSSNQWTSLAALPHAEGGMAGAVYKNKIYCFGGTNHDVGGAFSRRLQIYRP